MDDFPSARKALRGAAAATGGTAAVLLAFALLQVTGRSSVLALLSLAGLSLGALLAEVDLRALRRWPSPVFTGLAAIAASQAAFHTLVWTGWKTDSSLWRLWWIAMVASVTTAHVLALHLAAEGTGGRLVRWTALGAVLSAALLMSLALRKDLLQDPSPLFRWAWTPPAAWAVGGSVVVAVRWARRRREAGLSLPARARRAAFAASHAAVFLAGLYLGGTGPSAGPDLLPSALAGLPLAAVEAQARADLGRLRLAAGEARALAAKAEALIAGLRARRATEGRAYYRPEEDDAVRGQFASYLAARTALLRLAATYAGFGGVRDPDARARCFLLGYAAAASAHEAGLRLVHAVGDDEAARRKLNEAEPAWGLPEGLFDRVRREAADRRAAAMLAEMGAYHRDRLGAWRAASIWPGPDLDWLDARIRDATAYAEARGVAPARAWIADLAARVRQDAYSPVYAVQSVVATWIGDARIVEEAPLVTPDQIRALQARLKPGDILLERRNWYLSNAFLPGFWPHAALYVGTRDDLRRLGVADRPEVRARLEAFRAPAADGGPCTVIESVSEGVIFNSLSHSMHADYVAVLRPRLPPERIAEAVVRAFSHQGKPYDFEFDFFTSDKLVCTELVYRAYEGSLHFDLVRVMGRDTLPAIEIVRKFARERGTPRAELDLVGFLDGDPATRSARLVDEETFCRSADRPRVFDD